MPIASRIAAPVLTLFCAGTVSLAAAETDGPVPRQQVIVSFDGAHDIELWKRSRAMGERHGARFTYFLSCVFLLPRADAASYQGPGQAAGRSNVGFAQDHGEVGDRLAELWQARGEGHEIASHACGHFDGAGWSAADWDTEFRQFRDILSAAWRRAGLEDREPEEWQSFVATEITGFRAPYLSVSDALFAALPDAGYDYDASLVSNGPVEPRQDGGLLRFSLPMVPEGPSARPVIAMDYNFFARHTGAVETADEDGVFEARSLDALLDSFRATYRGDRAPLQIGYHFVEMNGGAYWRALDRFLGEVCGLSNVDCLSYAEAIAARAETPAAPF
jgi:peptidoglycan/xylan/chitin deacetylase (PgdA/CDA1 family)